MSPEVLAALVAIPVAAIFGFTGWRVGVRQANIAAETQDLALYQWAVTQVTSGNAGAAAGGWVVLQSLSNSPNLSAANRAMIETSKVKIRAVVGGTP